MADPKLVSTEQAWIDTTMERLIVEDGLCIMIDHDVSDDERRDRVLKQALAEAIEVGRRSAAVAAALVARKRATATWAGPRPVGSYKGWTDLRRHSGRLVGRYICRPAGVPVGSPNENLNNLPWVSYAGGSWRRHVTDAEARAYIASKLPRGVEVIGG